MSLFAVALWCQVLIIVGSANVMFQGAPNHATGKEANRVGVVSMRATSGEDKTTMLVMLLRANARVSPLLADARGAAG